MVLLQINLFYKFLVVQNLKIAKSSVFIFVKLFSKLSKLSALFFHLVALLL